LASCGNQKKEIKEYGFKLKDSDSLNVSIRISEFDNYENFLDRLKEIVCYDSIPNIVIESENQVRNIYPIEYCEIPMFHPRFRNTFFIRMDSIVKNERKVEISELSALMKQNYENMGVKEDFADSPEKVLFIFEYYENKGVDGIEKYFIFFFCILIGNSTQNLKSLFITFNFLKDSVLPITKVYKISEIFNEKNILPNKEKN